MTEAIENMVRRLTESSLGSQGLELLDVEVKDGLLRLTLDSESPLDLDRVAVASTLISRLIDDSVEFEELWRGPFNLEVSSPGLERTLRTKSHFERFKGSKVIIKTKPQVSGPRRISGVLLGVSEDVITIALEDATLGVPLEQTIRISDIERARTVFEWGSPKPPKKKAKGKQKQVKNSNSTETKIAKD